MRKRSKLLLGALVSFIGILCICGRTYASGAENLSAVSDSKDNFIFEKSAKWVKYNDNYTDENGKPYAQIDIKAKGNFTESEYSSEKENESIDVVLVIDCSYSMITCRRLEKSKVAAIQFVNNFLDEDDKNLRVGVVLYSDWVVDACGLTADKEKVINKINDSELVGETNIQSGLWVAQRMLNSSTADKKYVILLSDGAPTTYLRGYYLENSFRACYSPEEYDSILTNEKIEEIEKNEVASGENVVEKTVNQARLIENLIESSEIFTIGYDTSEDGDVVLNDIASEDKETHNKLFFKKREWYDDDIVLNKIYQAILNKIDSRKGSKILNVKISDQLPEGIKLVNYDLIEGDNPIGTLYKSEEGIISQEWINDGEMGTYHIRLIVSVDTDVLDKEYWNFTSYINTNGKSMDISFDSSDSAVLEFKYAYTGEWDKIGLMSPQLNVEEIYAEKDTCDDVGPIQEPELILDSFSEPVIPEETTSEPISNVILQSTPEPVIIQTPRPTPTIESEVKEENIIEEVNQEETEEFVTEELVIEEVNSEVTVKPTVDVREEINEPLYQEEKQIVNIEDEKIPLNSDKKENKELLPIIKDEFDDTPKTGYPEDIELGDLKNQYLITRRYGVCSKKYVMRNICIAIGILGIIFSAGYALLRGRKE